MLAASLALLAEEEAVEKSEDRARRIDLACWYVQDALDTVERPKPRATRGARAAFILGLHLAPWLPLVTSCFMMLTLFERPLWCLRAANADGVAICEDTELYPSFELPALAPVHNLIAEIAFISPLVLHAGAVIYAHGSAAFPDAVQLASFALVILTIFDILYAYATPRTWWRAAPYLRAGLHVLNTSSQRQQLAVLYRAVQGFYAVAALLVIFIVFSGWLATVLFPARITSEGTEVMPDVTEATYQMLILLTTANFPDVMMPAYTNHRGSVIFFAAYVFIGVFFLINYTLATVYDAWKTQDKLHLEAALESRQRSLAAAFTQLDWDSQGALNREQVLTLLEELPHASSFVERGPLGHVDENEKPPPLSRMTSNALASWRRSRAEAKIQRALAFAVLDAGGDSMIQPEEFSHLITVLHLHFERVDDRSLLQIVMPIADCGPTRLVAAALKHRAFEYGVDVVLVLSAVALACDTHLINSGGCDGLSATQVLFTLLFALEALMKVLLLPWRELISSTKHIFDISITSLCIVVLTLVYIPNGFDSGSVVRAVLSLRLLRLGRLLLHVPPFRKVMGTFVSLLPAASRLFGMFAVVLYLFSMLGTQLFGGIITLDTSGAIITPEQAAALANSSFGQAGYYPNNFNDLPSGVVTLFELLVVNNWQVITSGYVAVMGNMARWFFVAFYALGVVVMLNVVIAFVLDSYESYSHSEEEEDESEEKEKGETLAERVLDGHAVAGGMRFDAGNLPGGSETLRGVFDVTLQRMPLQHRGPWRGLLRNVFAQAKKSERTSYSRGLPEIPEMHVDRDSLAESLSQLMRPRDSYEEARGYVDARRQRSQARYALRRLHSVM